MSCSVFLQTLRNFRNRRAQIENVLGVIVVHLAHFANVIVQHGDLKLIIIEHIAGFIERPGEVVAIVVQCDVGILRAIKAAMLRGQSAIHPSSGQCLWPRARKIGLPVS